MIKQYSSSRNTEIPIKSHIIDTLHQLTTLPGCPYTSDSSCNRYYRYELNLFDAATLSFIPYQGWQIKITHSLGFFSCCSVRLSQIVKFANLNKRLPEIVDSSEQFGWYKNDKNKKKDITFDYFEHYKNVKDVNIIYSIDFKHDYQFLNYANLNYKNITPLIKKYFSPSSEINDIINNIKKKYKLFYKNICVLFYRGNDKNKETTICSYDEYLNYTNQLLKINPKLRFLIQSDETGFIEFMTHKFPNNSFYFNDEIRHMKKCSSTVDIVMKSQNYEFSKKYLAITIIMSRCKYIICGSGNCDMWIMLYKGNNKNVIQNLNRSYIRENQKNIWLMQQWDFGSNCRDEFNPLKMYGNWSEFEGSKL